MGIEDIVLLPQCGHHSFSCHCRDPQSFPIEQDALLRGRHREAKILRGSATARICFVSSTGGILSTRPDLYLHENSSSVASDADVQKAVDLLAPLLLTAANHPQSVHYSEVARFHDAVSVFFHFKIIL